MHSLCTVEQYVTVSSIKILSLSQQCFYGAHTSPATYNLFISSSNVADISVRFDSLWIFSTDCVCVCVWGGGGMGIFVIKYHGSSSSGIPVDTCWQTDTKKITGAVRDLRNDHDNGYCLFFSFNRNYLTSKKFSSTGFCSQLFAQSVIQMSGFRSLGDDEEVEFECKVSDKGLEATSVTGPEGADCSGSHRRPVSKKRFRRIR